MVLCTSPLNLRPTKPTSSPPSRQRRRAEAAELRAEQRGRVEERLPADGLRDVADVPDLARVALAHRVEGNARGGRVLVRVRVRNRVRVRVKVRVSITLTLTLTLTPNP